ncbi:peroxisome proliferator-activated receptor gamma coactivator 1-beta [Erpetoichthys calabaricus]|uniref:PPARG coactivator 1 beta n=1 Tax=Erpetoichthys calabaricus TaxID=27687 RepID=A0A8C4SEL3_ERPCA|nr:peroxisome proliferator-activated receptor gamma coactivator 1-beta [Erpetoichthys calabaricus]
MADCASLLDDELSFFYKFLTENDGSEYGEEVGGEHLDTDFPEIDLSQLESSDFDSVNCLGELQWCSDQSEISTAASHYPKTDSELFEIDDDNAALLAALTESLDEMAEVDEVGGSPVFPSLSEGSEGDDEEPPSENDPFPSPPSPETEDPSLLKKLLLASFNVPLNYDTHRQGSIHCHGNRSVKSRYSRPTVKFNGSYERKSKVFLPPSRQCTELHRHLTSSPEAEEPPSPCSDGASDSEEESLSEAEIPPSPCGLQFQTAEELDSVVNLIRYMHPYCLPTRKHPNPNRKEERDGAALAQSDCLPSRTTPAEPTWLKSVKRSEGGGLHRTRYAQIRPVDSHSVLRELLETGTSFDVSKPYRICSPPYATPGSPKQGLPQLTVRREQLSKAESQPAKVGHARDSVLSITEEGGEREVQKQTTEPGKEAEGDSYSVRRSRRLLSCPGRFAKKPRRALGRLKGDKATTGNQRKEPAPVKASCLHSKVPEGPKHGSLVEKEPESMALNDTSAILSEKRASLTLPLTSKHEGDTAFPSKHYEQTLSVELCGTAGLTPPTTPPHKTVDDDLFKPEVKNDCPQKGSWLTVGSGLRSQSRKILEQTELYAELCRTGTMSEKEDQRQEGSGQTVQRIFGDHDYCLQSAGERHKRLSVTTLPGGCTHENEKGLNSGPQWQCSPLPEKLHPCQPSLRNKSNKLLSRSGSPLALSLRNTREPYLRSSRAQVSGSSTVCCQSRSPSGRQAFSCENSETCHVEKQRNKTNNERHMLYVHNLRSNVKESALWHRFEAHGEPKERKVTVKDKERCRQAGSTPNGTQDSQTQQKKRETPFQISFGGLRKFCRKRYIDLDEGGPVPVKSKYDAMDFDSLLKEAQKSLHR